MIKSQSDLTRSDPVSDVQGLCEALLQPTSIDEMRRFLRDLTTPGELQALAERWRVARLLDDGGLSYREISAATGSSTTTVTRVARFLSQEDHQGYRLVLNRIKETNS